MVQSIIINCIIQIPFQSISTTAKEKVSDNRITLLKHTLLIWGAMKDSCSNYTFICLTSVLQSSNLKGQQGDRHPYGLRLNICLTLHDECLVRRHLCTH